MTEYEYLDLANTADGAIAAGAMNFVTMFFAYVVAAHFVGRRLPSGIALLLSASDSLFLLGPLAQIVRNAQLMVLLTHQHAITNPDGLLSRVPAFGSSELLVVCLVPPLLGWVGSIIYMHWYIRRTDEN